MLLRKIELFLKFRSYNDGKQLASREWYRYYSSLRAKVRGLFYRTIRAKGSHSYWYKIDKAKREERDRKAGIVR